MKLIKEFKSKIETELNTFCNDILDLINDQILSREQQGTENKVFFLKMKGDYQRYISEYAQGSQYDNASEEANQAYKNASELASVNLKTTNPIRLGLALNQSVFCYEVTSV